MIMRTILAYFSFTVWVSPFVFSCHNFSILLFSPHRSISFSTSLSNFKKKGTRVVCFLSLCISQNVLYYFHKLTTYCATINIFSQFLTFEIDLDLVPLSSGILFHNPEVWVQPDFCFFVSVWTHMRFLPLSL